MEDLSKYYFLPHSEIENFVNKMKTRKTNLAKTLCSKNLLDLQRKRNLRPSRFRGHVDWKFSYGTALRRSVLAQDWDKLQSLLGETPIWEMVNVAGESTHNMDNYIRALLVLLMYHPSARSQNLLHDYMHMVLGCRTDEDKKALIKILIAIPDKYPLRGTEE